MKAVTLASRALAHMAPDLGMRRGMRLPLLTRLRLKCASTLYCDVQRQNVSRKKKKVTASAVSAATPTLPRAG